MSDRLHTNENGSTAVGYAAAFGAMRLSQSGESFDATLRTLLWPLIGGLLVTDVIWASRAGLSIGGWGKPAAAITALLAFAALYQRRSRAIADMAAMAAFWVALSATGCVLTYLGATLALPLQDAVLTRFDQSLGLDWLAFRDGVAAQPLLNLALSCAYASLMPQVLLGCLFLPRLGRTDRCVELIFLAALTLLPTTLVSALWPALGPFMEFGGERVQYLPHVLALRAPGPWHFDMATMEGILTMPSYHAVLAVLFIYAFRRTGLVGWAVLAVNGVMLLSIAPIGGHYFADIIAGIGIAFPCIAVVRGVDSLGRHHPQRQPA